MTCRGKVALVTGAAGAGMGRSIALTLAREGAKVVVNYRTSQASAEAIVDHIVARGGSAVALQADVFDPAGCRRLVEASVEAFGRVDICVVGPGAGWHAEPLDSLEPAHALEDLDHEVAPVLQLGRLVLPGMYARGWGRLIGIALHPTELPPAYAYSLAKAARTQALLLAVKQAWPHGVTINVIAPAPVAPIESLDQAIEQCDRGDAWRKRPNVSPQDIAEGVAFLCSDAGRFVTGCVLPYMFH
ncbi:MAG: SDR family oxidoreductase [Anaerolineae bacterium]|nr:SDR family oxidoreductase [Anaerolineae bacterium]